MISREKWRIKGKNRYFYVIRNEKGRIKSYAKAEKGKTKRDYWQKYQKDLTLSNKYVVISEKTGTKEFSIDLPKGKLRREYAVNASVRIRNKTITANSMFERWISIEAAKSEAQRNIEARVSQYVTKGKEYDEAIGKEYLMKHKKEITYKVRYYVRK